MKKNLGFTLLEVILALGLSSIVLVALAKLASMTRSLDMSSNERMTVTRQSGLLLEQLQRDISAILPVAVQQAPDKKNIDDKNTQKPTPSVPAGAQPGSSTKKPVEEQPHLIVRPSDEILVHDGNRLQQLQLCSMVTTSSLLFDEKGGISPNRVGYRLVRTSRAREDMAIYRLERYQTIDLGNVTLKKPAEDTKAAPVQVVVLAENIKSFSMTCLGAPEPNAKGGAEPPQFKPLWGDIEQKTTALPVLVRVSVEWWNREHTGAYGKQMFVWDIPIVSRLPQEQTTQQPTGPKQNSGST